MTATSTKLRPKGKLIDMLSATLGLKDVMKVRQKDLGKLNLPNLDIAPLSPGLAGAYEKQRAQETGVKRPVGRPRIHPEKTGPKRPVGRPKGS